MAASEEHELHVKQYMVFLWSKRNFILKSILIFTSVGLLFAITSSKEFSVSSTLLPSNEEMPTGAGGLLETFGGLAGLNLNLSQKQLISSDLYPQIVHSTPFLTDILYSEVKFSDYDSTMVMYDFFTTVQKKSLLSYAKEYTVELPFTVLSWFRKEGNAPKGALQEKTEIVYLNKKQEKLLKALRKRILVFVDDESGLIMLEVEMPDPQASADVALLVVEKLTEYVIQYKTQKVNNELEFIKGRVEQAEEEFKKAQIELAKFEDQNFNITSSVANTKKRQLEATYQLKFDVLNSLSQQYEQVKIQKHRKTPIFQVINPVEFPLNKSKPQRILIVLGFFTLGGGLAVAFLTLKEYKAYIWEALLP